MFFVVYFCSAKKHVILPVFWVKDHELMIEKFINLSLNKNQEHLCFWSNKQNAQGEPHGVANFNAPLANDFSSTNDVCFMGKLVRYCRKYSFSS